MGLLGDIADFGKGVIENNLKWTERAAQIGRRLIRTARSPILTAGQQAIETMKHSTGVGDPENGQSFGQGADTMGAVGQVLGSAYPDDSWNSGGASAYAIRNTEQVSRVQTMLGLDEMVAGVLSTEAGQIAAARDSLDEHSDWLGAMSLLSTSAGVIPGFGTAAQMSAEFAMVAKAVGDSSGDLKTLSGQIDQNAAVLRTAAAQYETLADAAAPAGAEFAPPVGEDGEPEAPADPEPAASPATTAGTTAGAAGTPTGSSAPASAPAMASPSSATGAPPSSATGAPPSSAMASEAAGALGGILGSLVSPLSGILGGVLQAAGQAAQAGTQAGTQAAQLAGGAGELDKTSGGAGIDVGDPGGDDVDARDGRDEDAEDDEKDEADGEGQDDEPEKGQAAGLADEDSAAGPADLPAAGPDDGAAKTLPPDLEAVAAGIGTAGSAPVHVGADFEQGQLHLAAAATLDRGVPGSAAVIDR